MTDRPLRIFMDGDVLVYLFEDLGRDAAEMWATHVRSVKDNIDGSVRVLLDFTACGPPSIYAIQAQRSIASEVKVPDDTRVAYLIPDSSYKLWARMLKRNRAFGEEVISIFLKREDAMAWLLAPETPSSSSSLPPFVT